jgi:hypothetical protein
MAYYNYMFHSRFTNRQTDAMSHILLLLYRASPFSFCLNRQRQLCLLDEWTSHGLQNVKTQKMKKINYCSLILERSHDQTVSFTSHFQYFYYIMEMFHAAARIQMCTFKANTARKADLCSALIFELNL